MKKCLLITLSLTLIVLAFSHWKEKSNWKKEWKLFKQEALSSGKDPTSLKKAKPLIKKKPAQNPPAAPAWKYLETFSVQFSDLPTSGQEKLKEYSSLLNSLQESYGVDPAYLITIWRIETNYGSFMGSYPVLQALAKQAFTGSHKAYYKKELLLAIQMLEENAVSLEQFVGDAYGGTGQPQFLPSSWFAYAVDFDDDGHKNIWTSVPDVLASIANYLASNGWKRGEPCLLEVMIPNDLPPKDLTPHSKKPLSQWLKLGITPLNQDLLPFQDLEASLQKIPQGKNSFTFFLTFKNFEVLQRYNHAPVYAAFVGRCSQELSHP